MIKETGYCNYYDINWVKKYNELTYHDGEYYTEIIGNTFYLKHNVEKDSSNYWNWFEKLILRKAIPLHKKSISLCIIPMCTTQEETIRDVLRSWNFNIKYKWLDEELETEPECIEPFKDMKNISDRIFEKLFELNKPINGLRKELGYSVYDILRMLNGMILIPPYDLEKIATYLNTSKKYLIKGEE